MSGALLDQLLSAVRSACPSGLWSQGVKLAREGAVLVESVGDDEITARVRAPGFAVAPSVVLYPRDGEWACDCGGKVDPCAHVAAAVISATQAAQQGTAASPIADRPRARISYRFVRRDRTFALERFVMIGDTEAPLTGSVSALSARTDVVFAASHEDDKLDRILSGFRRGQFDWSRLPDVLALLAGCDDVRWDGERVKASAERVFPRARVVDGERRTVVLTVEKDETVEKVLYSGLVLANGALRPLGAVDLTGARLERLPLSRSFSPGELGELVTKVLPELEKAFPVEIKSRRLPRAGRPEQPWIRMEFSQREHTLSIVPTLVYGDPPRARIDDGKLVHLNGVVPIRNGDAERALVHRLRDELNLVFGRQVDFDGRDAARFLEKLKAWKTRDAQDSFATAGTEIFRKAPLVPRFELHGDGFDLSFETDDSEPDVPKTRADAASVLRAFSDGLSVVALEGGGFAPLPRDWLARYGDRIADLFAARDESGRVGKAALPALGDLCSELGLPKPPGLLKLAPLIEGFTGLPVAELPKGLRAELRTYQRQGVDWLCFLRDAELGAVLADDMGLGKTLQMLCAMAAPALVVCPKSVVFNWEQEIERFRPDLRVSVYQGKHRALDERADVTLVTYAVLRLDIEVLSAKRFKTVVLDEAQAIKNSDSQVARASYQLSGDFRAALTGTPVENRLEELWSLFRFTNAGLLGTRSDFQERYAGPIANGASGAAERLREKTRPFLLRRLKRDVAPELPPRTDIVLPIELDERERAVYDAVHAATRKEVLAELASGKGVLAALEALLRLRQAACHSALVPGQSAESSSKVERLVGALEEAAADGHKALVFSQWTSLLNLIEPHLGAAGIPFTRLDGTTRDRGAVVEQFQAESGPPVLLSSLKAGGTGLNLTAADHVFLVDPWWNPAVEDQAADRAHRIGQDKPVMVYRLVAKDTVEEGIVALQDKKRALSDVALGGADQAGGLTREDLLALLG